MKRLLFALILFPWVLTAFAATPVSIGVTWESVPNAAGYKFFLKDMATGALTEIGGAQAGTTSTTFQIADISQGSYTLHGLAYTRIGTLSDLSPPAVYSDTGAVVEITKPASIIIKIKIP